MFYFALKGKMNDSSHGFTLLEILISLVMGSVIITAICTLIVDQTQTHEDHQMQVMMQQNGRAALSFIANELMLAGYSPGQGGGGRVASVETADIDQIKVTFDRSGNGAIKRSVIHNDGSSSTDYSEQTILSFNAEDRKLVRNNQVLLRDVEAFRVLYAYDKDDVSASGYGRLEPETSAAYWAYDSDEDGELDTRYDVNSDGTLTGGGAQDLTTTPSPTIDRIRAAKIWLLLRSNKKKNKDQDTIDTYSIPGDDVTLDSDYSYRLYTTTVKLRNMYY